MTRASRSSTWTPWFALWRHDRADALDVVVLELLHRDIPHLKAAGLIEYDSRSETVAATDRIATVEPLFAAAGRVERALQSDVPLSDSSD